MAKQFSNGYQLDDLRAAAQAVVQATPGLSVEIGFNGKQEATVNFGVVPMVEFLISQNGQRRTAGTHPAPTVARQLANALAPFVAPANSALVDAVRNSPVQ